MNPDAEPGSQGRKLMEDKLREYLARQAMKKDMKKSAGQVGSGNGTPTSSETGGSGEVSEALKRKDREREARAASRRRVRGGAPEAASARRAGPAETLLAAIHQQEEAIMA